MIIHKLIFRHLQHRDDAGFYELQAQDAVAWMVRQGVALNPGVSVLDVGCGHGIFGAEFLKRGCDVTFADECNTLADSLKNVKYLHINLDQDDLAKIGQFDLVLCSNVYEHLSRPDFFLGNIANSLKIGGKLYLTWTNWLSPWGGHEFSPFHYLGSRHGHLVYDRLMKRKRNHTPHENLFPTYIGQTMKKINLQRNLKVLKVVPRYYTELAFLMRIPVFREFFAWNCAILAVKQK
jgi:SAM-dependent methyltransferase